MNFRKRSSFNSREMTTAINVFNSSFTILSTRVLLKALQNPGMENILVKFSSPMNTGSLIPL